MPKIFYVNTAYEYWSRGASLIHTTPDSACDVEPAPSSRAYLAAGLGHFAGEFPPARRMQSPSAPSLETARRGRIRR